METLGGRVGPATHCATLGQTLEMLQRNLVPKVALRKEGNDDNELGTGRDTQQDKDTISWEHQGHRKEANSEESLPAATLMFSY